MLLYVSTWFIFLENNGKKNKENISDLEWFSAKKIEFDYKHSTKKEFKNTDFFYVNIFQDLSLKIVKPDKVAITLKQGNCENIIQAESQHSDLLPAKYEGKNNFNK